MAATVPPLEDLAPTPGPEAPIPVLHASATSDVKALAGAIAGNVRRSGAVEIQVIGASALNQAIKAAAVARTVTAREGLDLALAPEFHTVEIDGDKRTALRLVVDHRPPASRPTVASS